MGRMFLTYTLDRLSGMFGQIFGDAVGGRLHGFLAFLPVGRADFAVLLGLNVWRTFAVCFVRIK